MMTYEVTMRWEASSYIEASTFADGETVEEAIGNALDWAAERGLMSRDQGPQRVDAELVIRG